MKRILDLSKEEHRLFEDILNLVAKIRAAVLENSNDLLRGIEILAGLRQKTYEDINQIQHEAVILKLLNHSKRGTLLGKT